jgi:hypothetical protein
MEGVTLMAYASLMLLIGYIAGRLHEKEKM